MKFIENFCEVTQIKDGKLSAIASTPVLDRDGEIILPSAFLQHLNTYRANPIVLAYHRHVTPDGTPSIIGKVTKIGVEDNALKFTMDFADTALATEWQSLFQGGYVRSFSVGFIPIAGTYDTQKQAYVHTEIELLEISAVAVPANPEAIVTGKGNAGNSRFVIADELESVAAAGINIPELSELVVALRTDSDVSADVLKECLNICQKARRVITENEKKASLTTLSDAINSLTCASLSGGSQRVDTIKTTVMENNL